MFKTEYPLLYRFLPAKADRVIDILVNNNIYHSSVQNFNDPFELRIRIKHPKEKKELVKYFERTLLTNDQNSKNRIFRKNHAKQIADSFYNGKILNETALRAFSTEKLRETTNPGICCFSTDKGSLLLWAHYAQNHKGCCIEFDFTDTTPIGIVPLKVIYSHNFQEIEFFSKERDLQDLLNKTVLTKSQEWCYEKEYRSIKLQGPGKYKLDNPKQIKKIFIGAMADESLKDEIKNIIKDYNLDLDIYQGILDSNSYKINFEKIEV